MSTTKLPSSFVSRMKDYLGEVAYEDFSIALDKEPRVSIRWNALKSEFPATPANKVPWCESGYFLDERPSFTLDPSFHAGAYYVQEASSMFIEHILKSVAAPKDGIYLDLSAAPGGKSTLLSSYLGHEGFLVANEVIKARASILKENIIKWGWGNTLVTNNDPEHFSALEGFFDLVLVDAPCSGEGMFRKDQDARNEWSPEHVQLCASRQERIMDQAGGLVKAGGYLLYSTCTFNEEENEEMVKFIASEFSFEPVRLPLDPAWNIVETEVEADGQIFFGYRFFPHKVESEGFFVSVFKRPEDAYIQEPKKSKEFKHPFIKSLNKQEVQKLDSLFNFPENTALYVLQDSYFWLNADFQNHFEFLTKHLNIKYFGVELGKLQKEQLIPSHEWAMSFLEKKDFPSLELSKEQALDFLRKEDIHPEGLPMGWVLVTFENLPLGWLKNLGNRTNNYYPKEWRIRMR